MPRLLAYTRMGLILLVIASFAQLLPAANAFTNGQAASLVLGQPDFTSRNQDFIAKANSHPSDVAIDPLSGKVFVSDADNNRVLRFASASALINSAAAEGVLGQSDFTSNAHDTTASGMWEPSAITIDMAGRLWVADRTNSRVLRFDNAINKANGALADGVLGQNDFTSNIQSTTANGMNYPFGLAVDDVGHLWVVDSLNNRVLRFDDGASKANGAAADGVLGQKDFTSSVAATTASGMSYNPFGAAVDSAGRLWVADTDNNRILRFDNAASKPNGAAADGVLGQKDFTSSAFPKTASGMKAPIGVAVDTSGHLWVADGDNNRVLRFDNASTKLNGAAADSVLGQNNFTSDSFAATATGLHWPHGLAVDSVGNLWVSDFANHRVLRFDSTIKPTITWTTPAAIPYGTALSAAQLNASASVPGTFTYNPPAGTVLDAGSGQTLSVVFTPDDLVTYTTVTTTVTIDVIQASQTITFGALANKAIDDAPFNINATASSGLLVTFSSATQSVCTASSSTVTLVAAGTCTITANQAGNNNFSAATPVTQSFTVTAATEPSLTTLHGNRGAPGSMFTLAAQGFDAGEQLQVMVNGRHVLSGTVDSDGTFRFALLFGVGTPPGSYTITVSSSTPATQQTVDQQVQLTVTIDPTAAVVVAPTDQALPQANALPTIYLPFVMR